jgi:hypothetical protein
MLRLTTLLAQTLVAYTVEFDNEFEHRTPHRTTVGGQSAGGGPWLVSMVMRHVSDVPIPVLELEQRARTPTNLDGMRRWGYVDVAADPEDTRAKPPRAALVVRATAQGLEAQEMWVEVPVRQPAAPIDFGSQADERELPEKSNEIPGSREDLSPRRGQRHPQ